MACVDVGGALECQGLSDPTVFCEIPASPRERFAPDAGLIQRVGLVKWDQYHTVAQQLLGGPFVQGGVMYRHLPARHPRWLNFYATRVDLDGVGFRGKDGAFVENINRHELARLVVTYETLFYPVIRKNEAPQSPEEAYRFVRRTVKGAGEFLSTIFGYWVFEGTGQEVSSRVGVWQRSSIIIYEWFDVHPQGIDLDHVRANIVGRTNQFAFTDVKGTNFPIGTLLLLDAEEEPHVSPFGDDTLKITYSMYYRPDGVNTAPNPADAMNPAKIHAKGDPTKHPVQEADFTFLWKNPGT